MRHSRPLFRLLAVGLVAVALVGTSGCNWFRKGSDLYAASPENRPLEVPPDLDRPDTSGAMALPQTGTVTRSAMPAAGTAAPNGFAVSGERDEVYARVGEALAATQGLTVVNQLKTMPIEDMFARNGKVRADGRMVHDMHLVEVKSPQESKGRWDYYKILSTIPGNDAFLPLSESKCPLVKG